MDYLVTFLTCGTVRSLPPSAASGWELYSLGKESIIELLQKPNDVVASKAFADLEKSINSILH